MSLSSREIDALEDVRVIMVARAQGAYGLSTMRIHANHLMQGASAAYGQGDLEQAIWLAEREVQFNCMAWGFGHPYTNSSVTALSALKRASDLLKSPRPESVQAAAASPLTALAIA